ncbi:MAG: hypothetical protein K6A41_03240 [Bacteroidales bacterium]|nr:hypothetical protein [Bacteroidales bacterium]
MSEEIQKVPREPKANGSSRRPTSIWRWIILVACILLLVVGILHVTQQRKETYEYHFTVQKDTANLAEVGIEEINITHRWTPMGGLYPKITIRGLAKVDGTDIRYAQFVYKTDKEREWNVADANRHNGDHYTLILRDIPEGRILACMLIAVTKDGRKITSEPYAFHTKRTE